MEWLIVLIGILVLILIVLVASLIISARRTRNRDDERRRKQRLDAPQARLEQRSENNQQMKMICGPSPLALGSDESVVFVLPGVRLLEPRAIRRSRSGSGGPRIRLTKWLSVRLGGGASRSESSDELRDIDQGTLVLTTKRLAFMGSLRTSSVRLDDIIGVQTGTDGIEVHRERKERPETYVLGRTLQIVEGPSQGLTVSSPMIRTAIEVAKTRVTGSSASLARPVGGQRR